MSKRPPISNVIGLAPDDTVRAFEARDELRTTVRWSEMWHEDHARAFTVAKVAKLDLLAEIQSSLADVMANGGTFEQWQAGLVPYLQKQGWWGDVADRELTGTDETLKVGPRRLRTIYDTNLRVSRAAGRWTRIQEMKDVRPFLRYTAVLDSRTRPEHRAWHGTILPVDDEWWDTHFPPCGWYCRCTVRQLSQRELTTKGWKISDVPPSGPPQLFFPAGRTEPVEVPAGISPGFAYNPGKASMASVADKARRSLEAMAPIDLAAARATLDDLVKSDAFLETLREPGAVFPVMVLSADIRAALSADAHVVGLSSDTYAKQRGLTARSAGYLDLTIEEYRFLPSIGAAPDYVFQERDRHVMMWRRPDPAGVSGRGRYLQATVKTTASGSEMYVKSFRYAGQSELDRAIAGGTKARPSTRVYGPAPIAVSPLVDEAVSQFAALARSNPQSARAELQAFIASGRFEEMIATAGEAPVMALARRLLDITGTTNPVVHIGAATYEGTSKDLVRRLPPIGIDADHMFADGPDRFMLWKVIEGEPIETIIERRHGGLFYVIAMRISQAQGLADVIATFKDLLA